MDARVLGGGGEAIEMAEATDPEAELSSALGPMLDCA
jgi:hypothetical protein